MIEVGSVPFHTGVGIDLHIKILSHNKRNTYLHVENKRIRLTAGDGFKLGRTFIHVIPHLYSQLVQTRIAYQPEHLWEESTSLLSASRKTKVIQDLYKC